MYIAKVMTYDIKFLFTSNNYVCTYLIKISCLFTAPGSLKLREEIRVDPFKQGFAHSTSGQYNLNQVRLCFQVFLRQPNNSLVPVDPVVSNVIYDAKAHKDLNICNYSDNCAPIEGGKKILLFCEKISRDDIEIRFSYTDKSKHVYIFIISEHTGCPTWIATEVNKCCDYVF